MRNKPTASAFDPVNEKMVGVGFVKVVHGPTSAVKSTSCQPKALPANFFINALVLKSVAKQDLKSCAHIGRMGSSPIRSTKFEIETNLIL